jgi:hypothetical protein
MEAVRTSETSVDNHSTRQYNPEDSSEHHTRRRENLKSHIEDHWLFNSISHDSFIRGFQCKKGESVFPNQQLWSSRKISNDNGIITVYFVIWEYLIVT